MSAEQDKSRSSICCFLHPQSLPPSSLYLPQEVILSHSAYSDNGQKNIYSCRESNSGPSARGVTILTELRRLLHFWCELMNRDHKRIGNADVVKSLPKTMKMTNWKHVPLKMDGWPLYVLHFGLYLACYKSGVCLVVLTLRDRFH
jgi:hypothetical protein